ncbi:MAG: hypothetical protein AB1567_04025 [bacterium]
MPIIVQNNGAEIIYTNYWQSEYAQRGFFYLSINAGTFRLLVPTHHEVEIADWEKATEVIVSRGPWPQTGKLDAVEILFEDGTSNPYAIHLGSESVDRMPLDTDQDHTWRFTVWMANGKRLEFPCRYRVVKSLPCLEEWKKR